MSRQHSQMIMHEGYLGRIRLELDTARDMERAVLEGRVWSEEVVHLISMLVKPGDHVIDVGANSGLLTLPLAVAVGETGKVMAFEPDRDSLAYLRRNIAHNPELAPHIEVVEAGLGDRRQELFVYHDTDGGNAYLSTADNPLYGSTAQGPRACQVLVLDEFLHEVHPPWPRLDFIKIDVEGMEHLVLQGARKSLAIHKPIVVFETLLNCFPEKNIRQAIEVLGSLDYQVFVKKPGGKILTTSFPNLGEDTVAIHPERATACLHVFLNAVKLHFSVGPLAVSPVWFGAMRTNEPLLRVDNPQAAIYTYSVTESMLTIQVAMSPEAQHVYTLPVSALTDPSVPTPCQYDQAGYSSVATCAEIIEGDGLLFL